MAVPNKDLAGSLPALPVEALGSRPPPVVGVEAGVVVVVPPRPGPKLAWRLVPPVDGVAPKILGPVLLGLPNKGAPGVVVVPALLNRLPLG